MLALIVVLLVVTLAVTVSAPVVVEDAGERVTVATPEEFVSADVALKVPTELLTEKVTTSPASGLPELLNTLAVTVAGEALLTVVEESETVTVDAEDVVDVEVEVEVPPSGCPPALQPANTTADAHSNSHFFMLFPP